MGLEQHLDVDRLREDIRAKLAQAAQKLGIITTKLKGRQADPEVLAACLEGFQDLISRLEQAGNGGQGQDDAEARKVEAHCERYAEDFRRIGTPKEAIVKAFRSARRVRPNLTAEAFLNARGR